MDARSASPNFAPLKISLTCQFDGFVLSCITMHYPACFCGHSVKLRIDVAKNARMSSYVIRPALLSCIFRQIAWAVFLMQCNDATINALILKIIHSNLNWYAYRLQSKISLSGKPLTFSIGKRVKRQGVEQFAVFVEPPT